ncbi:ATP-binding protein [Ammoniphilus sp. CFH 90114]|uniref:sensor histidine kinase n=1 Tax=Ammoniphilus sp. CFH 90114 TaxID=2493665 RepID=UPI001F0BFC1C|nr:ATP-binding protein [Ammoniphilus sp. CFH 90114]
MKQSHRLVSRINSMVTILLLLIGVLASFLMKELIDHLGVGYIEEDVTTKAMMLSQSINITKRLDEQLEQKYDERLYISAKSIANELKGKDIRDITSDDLRILSKEWNVEDITLMTRQEDGNFLFAMSTNPKEIGYKTGTDWGFWHTAFTQLWERKPLDVPSGRSFSNGWIGPLVDSETQKGEELYKFAYYYNGETDFIIAPFIIATDLKNDDHTVRLLNTMLDNNHIKEISVINVNSFLNPVSEIHDTKVDLPVLYGNNTFSLKQDKEIVQALYQDSNATSHSINFTGEHAPGIAEDGRHYQKYYIKIPTADSPVDRMMMLVMDMGEYDRLKTQSYLVTFVVSALTIMIILLLIQWITRQQLRPMEAIIQHIKRVSKGDFSSRLSISNKNEFEWLGKQLNDMTERMGDMIHQINRQANEEVTFTQSAYHEELKKLMTSVESIRHDFHNHMSVVKGLIQIGSPDRALDYLTDITKEVNRIRESMDIKNPELSVFFHSKFLTAENNQVQLRCVIEADPFDFIPSLDQIKIYSNLIDNALDEVLKLPYEQRRIHITLKREPESYYFRVDNSGDEIPPQHLDRLFELGFSTKPTYGENNRGSGLPIVKQTIEKYGGELNVYRKDHMTCFEVRIPFLPSSS